MKIFALLLVACVMQVCNSSPARRELRLPETNSSPEILNDLDASASVNSVNIEETIKEVEDLIKSNPKLPRLTRGEILEIIENITKTDEEKSSHRDQKAVMYVMPYSPDSAQNGDMQALYTKPPVTHLVGDQKTNQQDSKKPTQNQIEIFSTKPAEKTKHRSTTKPTTQISDKTKIPEITNRPRTRRPEIVTQTPMTSTTMPYRPIRRRTTSKPLTTKFYNHKYPDDEVKISSEEVVTPQIQTAKPLKTIKPIIMSSSDVVTPQIQTSKPFKQMSNQGINIIEPPKFNIKPNVEQKPVHKSKPVFFLNTQTTPDSIKINTSPTLAPVIPANMQLPEDFKNVLKNLDVLLKQDPGYNQHESVLHIINSEAMKPTPPSFQQLPEVTSPVPEFQKVANDLAPDMKELLMNFGLIPNPIKEVTKQEKHAMMQPSLEINPDSYSNFKPLPNTYSSSNDESMDDFLAKFGLGTKSGQRSQKAISVSKSQNDVNKQSFNFDVVPDNLKSVLKDIGITYKDMKTLSEEKTKKLDKQHVFNPAHTQYATENEINKLNKLASVIKQLEKLNGSASDEDLKQIDLEGLKELVGSLNLPLDEQTGPNPLDYDKGLDKNEVKRQQNTTTTTTPSTSVVTEGKNPSFADLEESFGGAQEAVKETSTTTTTEAPRKSGFYYLVDWNSFFDIDNQNGKRVNLRFQPTIGDPKRFFSVNVP